MRGIKTAFIVATALSWSLAQAQVGNNDSILNPNLAGEDELAGVAHLDAALDALLSGSLSEEQRADVYAALFLPLNLNTASGDEIMLIPGMNNRMTHEFEEYRPYTSLEQFRQEIGKYVDDDEVARLEQYVFVPLNLNTATRDVFATVPGASNRMVREFLEYQPYSDMDHFRREIGKYVDEDEVGRFERYMTLD